MKCIGQQNKTIPTFHFYSEIQNSIHYTLIVNCDTQYNKYLKIYR